MQNSPIVNNADTPIVKSGAMWMSFLVLVLSVPLLRALNIPLNLAVIAAFVIGLSLWIFSSRKNLRKTKSNSVD